MYAVKRQLGDLPRVGIALAVFNAVLVLISFVIYQNAKTFAAFGFGQLLAQIEDPANFFFIIIWLIFLYFTAFELAVGLPLSLLSCWLPNLRRGSAKTILSLAVTPWIFCLTFAFAEIVLRRVIFR
jgi:hypothetical protein